MVPAFGFSAGDFINGAELIKEIISALEGRGATEYYPVFRSELESLLVILDHLQNLRGDMFSDQNLYNAIGCQAAALQGPLASLLEKITQKYDLGLGLEGPKWWKTRIKKINWALNQSQSEYELRKIIGARLVMINTLLGLSVNMDRSHEETWSRLDALQVAVDRQCRQTQSDSQLLVQKIARIRLEDPMGFSQEFDKLYASIEDLARLVKSQSILAEASQTHVTNKSTNAGDELRSIRDASADSTSASLCRDSESSTTLSDQNQELTSRDISVVREAQEDANTAVEQGAYCENCAGDQDKCDCSLRSLMRWNSRVEESIKPAYVFTDSRGRRFQIEFYEKLCNGGWARAPDPTVSGQFVYVDMLASQSERMYFYNQPILEQDTEVHQAKKLHRSWRRVENSFGRTYYEHLASGLGMYQHPSESILVDQNTGYPHLSERKDCAILDGKWIIDDPDAPCQLSCGVFSKIQKNASFDLLQDYAPEIGSKHTPHISSGNTCCSIHKFVADIDHGERKQKYLECWQNGLLRDARGSLDHDVWTMGEVEEEESIDLWEVEEEEGIDRRKGFTDSSSHNICVVQ